MPKAGTAYIRIEGDFTPFHRQLAKEGRNLSRRIDIKADTRGLRNLNSTLGDTSKQVHVAEKRMRSFDISATSVNTHMAFMRNLFRVVKWPSIAAGFGLVAEGAAAAGAGIVSLTAALAPLTGLLATVPTGLAALAQGLGTVQLATFGVGDALGLLEKQHQSSATAAANNADTQKQSADTIRNAEEALADAHRAEKEAQDDLTDAHEDAREALIDLRFAAEESVLSEKRAALNLKQARNEQARLIKDQTSSASERRSAALDVAEAELALREARQESKDTAEELNESERKGVEQSDQVVDARKALADAERATASAARALKSANQDAKDALEGTDAAADNLRKQFASMTPEAREFAKFLYDLRPQLMDLRQTAARGLLPGVEDGITAAMKNFPELENVVDATAKSFGRIAKESGEYFGREGVGRDIESLGLKNAKRFEVLADAGLDFGDALRHITMAAQPLVDFLVDTTADFAEWTKEEAKAGRESGRLAHFFRQTRDVTSDLIDMGGDLAHILSRIGEAAAPTGRNLLDDLSESVEDLREWTDTEGGKNALRKYFEDSQPAIEEMGALVGDLVKGFFSLTQDPNLAPFIKKVRTELLPVLLEITKLLTATLGPELIDLFVQLAHVMREIGTPALVTFVKFTTEALHLINQVFTSIPGLAQAAAVALGGFSIIKLLGLQRAAGLGLGFATTFAQAFGVEITRGQASTSLKNAGAVFSERFAGGAKYAMGAAFAGIGFAAIINDVIEGDWGEAAAEAGGMIAGAIAGGIAGGLPGAMLGAGLGALIGGALNDLFSTDELPEVKKIPYIQELRNQFRDLAKDAQKAAQNAHGAINNYVRTSERIRDARHQEKRASQDVKQAEDRLATARDNYSDDSRQVINAERALKRAREGQEEITRKLNRLERVHGDTKDAAKGAAQRAIRVAGVEIKQARELVSEYRRRLHAMSETERRSEAGEKLSRRLTGAQSDLAGAVRRANKVIEDAGEEIGGHFAKNLDSTLRSISRFHRNAIEKFDTAGGLFGYIEDLNNLVPKTKKPMGDLGAAAGAVQGAIDKLNKRGGADARAFAEILESTSRRGRTSQTDLVGKTEDTESALGQAYDKAGAHVENFDKTTYWGLFNVLSNFAKALKVVDVKAPGNFDLSKPKGNENKAQGGTVGKGAIVPGSAPGDRHLLSLNGVPIANVESGELISVTNRSATAEQMAINDLIPRRALGGLVGFQDGGWLATVGGVQVDRRIAGDAQKLLTQYRLAYTAGYATSGHAASGEHPLGLALDIIPGPGGSWDRVTQLAHDAEPSQGNPIHPWRWVGYTGDSGHGIGDHLHLSWDHTGGLPPPVPSVETMQGAIGGMVEQIAREIMTGPDGVMLQTGQTIIDRVRKAANKELNSIFPPVTGEAGGAGITGTTYSGPLDRRFPQFYGFQNSAGHVQLSHDQVRKVLAGAGFGDGKARRSATQQEAINFRESQDFPGVISDRAYDRGYGLGQLSPVSGQWGPEAVRVFNALGGEKGMSNPVDNARMQYWLDTNQVTDPWAATAFARGGIVAALRDGGILKIPPGVIPTKPPKGGTLGDFGNITAPFNASNILTLLRNARGAEDRAGVVSWATSQFKRMSDARFIDENGDLSGKLLALRGEADLYSENADFADALSRTVSFTIPETADRTSLETLLAGIVVNNPFTGDPLSWAELIWGIGSQELRPGDDVDVDIPGMFQGLDQGDWIVKQLEALFNLRNNLIVDQGALSNVKDAVKKLLDQLNGKVLTEITKRIKRLKEELERVEREKKRADAEWQTERDKIQDKLDKRATETQQLQKDLAKEKAKPIKEQSQAKINRIETELAKNSVEVNALQSASDRNDKRHKGTVERLAVERKDFEDKLRREEKTNTTVTDIILPMVSDRFGVIEDGENNLIEELRTVQGSGVSQDVLAVLPELGVLKGEIGQAQLDLFNLGRGQPTIAADGIDTPDMMHIQDLIEFSEAIQAGAFKTQPYGSQFAGFFAEGGRIPRGMFGVAGETGLPEIIEGPARVYAPGQTPDGQTPVIRVIVEDGAVDPDKIRVVAGQEFDVKIERRDRAQYNSWLAGAK